MHTQRMGPPHSRGSEMLPLDSPLCHLPPGDTMPSLPCSASPGQHGDQQHKLEATLPGLKTGSEKLINSSKP